MTGWPLLTLAVLAFVTAERMIELLVAQHNTRRLLAQGAVEHGAGHYPLIVVLHAAWLAGLWALAWQTPPDFAWLAAFGMLQVLRLWTLASLGRRWTTRIVTVPGERLVRRGPYRYVRHPNYLVVVGEILVLPLVFGLPLFAAVFTLLNAMVLTVRVRAENRALTAGTSSAGARV